MAKSARSVLGGGTMEDAAAVRPHTDTRWLACSPRWGGSSGMGPSLPLRGFAGGWVGLGTRGPVMGKTPGEGGHRGKSFALLHSPRHA